MQMTDFLHPQGANERASYVKALKGVCGRGNAEGEVLSVFNYRRPTLKHRQRLLNEQRSPGTGQN